MSCVTMAPRAIVRTNIAMRGLQFLSSLAAMALISASFQDTVFSPLLGSRSASFLLLMTYSTMLYAGWFLVCVELYPLVPRPRMLMMRALDSTSVVMLLTSAIVMVNSEFVSQCGTWNGIIACKNLHASIFFSFAAALLFIATIALTYVKNAPDLETTMEVSGYVIDSTPTNAVFSPCAARNAPPTPSAKV